MLDTQGAHSGFLEAAAWPLGCLSRGPDSPGPPQDRELAGRRVSSLTLPDAGIPFTSSAGMPVVMGSSPPYKSALCCLEGRSVSPPTHPVLPSPSGLPPHGPADSSSAPPPNTDQHPYACPVLPPAGQSPGHPLPSATPLTVALDAQVGVSICRGLAQATHLSQRCTLFLTVTLKGQGWDLPKAAERGQVGQGWLHGRPDGPAPRRSYIGFMLCLPSPENIINTF